MDIPSPMAIFYLAAIVALILSVLIQIFGGRR